MYFSIGIYSYPMGHLYLVGLYTTRLPVFRLKAMGYDWILVDSIGQPSGIYMKPTEYRSYTPRIFFRFRFTAFDKWDFIYR